MIDVPAVAQVLFARSGRVGRAGRPGAGSRAAVTFAQRVD